MSRTLRRLIPSPAMIVALVALVMSLGSSAYALMITGQEIKNNSVYGEDIHHGSLIGKDIHKHSLRGHDLRADSVGGGAIRESTLTVPSAEGLYLWADVTDTGMVERGRDVVAGKFPSVVHSPPGEYLVTFSREVDKCSYQATIGGGGSPKDSQIAASHPSNLKTVYVRTAYRDPSGNSIAAPRAFQLAVIC